MPAEESASTSEGSTLTVAELDRLFEAVSNWGRWGGDDELGTLNFAGEAETAHAATLVRSGRTVSLGRSLDTTSGPDNDRPALHYMTRLGDGGTGEPSFYMDFIGVDFHGKSASHVDALCHVAYKGLLYNARRAADAIGSRGSSFAAIDRLSHGVVTRGVLLDVARARGLEWIEPPEAIGRAELAAVAARAGVEPRRGDALLVRSGAVRRRHSLGAWNPDESSVGLAAPVMEWLAESQVAILGGDGDSDAHPGPAACPGGPVHVLALNAMGMPLLDNLDLEALSEACAEAGRYEFLLALAPLIVSGGTGSPLNPIAVL